MTNNIEKVEKTDSVHIILAVRRSKENEGQTHKDELCFREIVRGSTEETVGKMKARISSLPGIWRIYHTVNARDTRKATKLLMHELLDNFEDQHYRVDSLYKKMLLQTHCRATKNFMLDIDSKEPEKYYEAIAGLCILNSYSTPNGIHVIVAPFNLKNYNIKDVTVVRDGYYFLGRVEIK